MAKDYNAINFKNKDIDKFSSRFGQPDPGKGIVSQAKDAMNTIANSAKSKGTDDNSVIGKFYQEAPAKNKNERYFESPDKKNTLTLKGFPNTIKKIAKKK